MKPSHERSFTAGLRPVSVGLILGLVTILFGQGLGIVFGANEAAIKNRLRDDAVAVEASVYRGDEVAIKAVLDKSWAYMKRSHMHATSLGATAIPLILLAMFLTSSRWKLTAISLALGGGGLGYAVFWMLAGFRAPRMGGTGPAKESLEWLAIPSSGLFVAGTVAVTLILVWTLVSPSREGAVRSSLE